MTVANSLNKHTYRGNDVATSFPYTFKIFTSTDMQVILTDIATGTDTVLSTNYTVNTNTNTVTYPVIGTPLTSATKITLNRAVPITQETALPNGGPYLAQVIEKAFDKGIIIAQQQQEQIDRTLKLAITVPDEVSRELPSPASKMLLRWNEASNALENSPPGEDYAAQAAASAATIGGFLNYSATAKTADIITKSPKVDIRAFYPAPQIATAGTSTPLSTRFTTLADAQAVYPHATALTDELDWCVIQAAFNYHSYGEVLVPKGNYTINQTLIMQPEHKIIGDGRLSTYITQTDNTKYAFSLDLEPSVNQVSLVMTEMCINAKYGIRLNREDTTTDFTTAQGFILGAKLSHLYFVGRLYEITDPYKDTNTVPTFSELYAQGVGLSANKMFDSQVELCQFTNQGIGIWFRGCDINTITNCRFSLNSRHYHGLSVVPGDGNHYGSQNKILNSDILVHYRIGGIWTNEWWDGIQNNYFECRTAAAQYITTANDIGTLIANNRFDSTSNPTTPIMSLFPAYNDMITGNRFNPNGQTYTIEVGNTYYDYSTPNLVIYRNNSTNFPLPDYPHVLTAEYNPLLMRYNNTGNKKYLAYVGTLATQWMWQYNSAVYTYTIKNTDPAVAFLFYLQNPTQRRYRIEIVCRKATLTPTSNYSYTVKCAGYGDSGETSLLSGNIGVASSTTLERLIKYITIPDAINLYSSHVTVTINNTDTDIASIELFPIDSTYATAAPTTNTYKLGDKVYNSSPGAGGYEGWICTTAGQAAATAWVPSTTYAVGDIRYANSKVYQCTVAGTSSTIAPAHTTGSATDGTVTWLYVNILAVFKGVGVIAS